MKKQIARKPKVDARPPIQTMDGLPRAADAEQTRAKMEAAHGVLDRRDRYRRWLREGPLGAYRVIDRTPRDRIADQAVREYIAELLESGNDAALTSQLRAFAVGYLVNPVRIVRPFDD